MITQTNALASLAAAQEMLGIGPRDVLVSWVPPWHDLGLLRFVLGPVFFGAPCHLVPPAIRTLPLWLRTASEVRATLLGAPDFAWRLATRLVDPAGLDLSSLRYSTNGGEPVRRSTILAFEERFGVPGVIRPGYGLAEATLGVTGLRPGEALRVDDRGHVSCGRPFPGVEVRIAEDGTDGVGEILVRGAAVFAGYFDQPTESAEILRGGWLHTGDAGRLDADGHLYVLGRRRAMLKRGGAPLAPREVEEAAAGLPGLRLAAAVGLAGGAGERHRGDRRGRRGRSGGGSRPPRGGGGGGDRERPRFRSRSGGGAGAADPAAHRQRQDPPRRAAARADRRRPRAARCRAAQSPGVGGLSSSRERSSPRPSSAGRSWR